MFWKRRFSSESESHDHEETHSDDKEARSNHADMQRDYKETVVCLSQSGGVGGGGGGVMVEVVVEFP